jgi:glycosidase
MKKITLVIVMAALFSCQGPDYPVFPEDKAIIGLAMPLPLNPGENEIVLVDYFPDPSLIDSVYFNEEKIILSEEKSKTFLQAPTDGKPMMELVVWVGGNIWSVPVRNSRKILTTITFDPDDNVYRSVQLSGEFNGWTPSRNAMEFKEGLWQTSIHLNPGTYMYQIVADGQTMTDPGNPEKVDNNFGGFNSVLRVGEQDKGSIPFLITNDFSNGEIEISATVPVDEYLVYWQNFRLDHAFLELEGNDLEITVPAQAKKMKRSYIRVYAYNSNGVSNDLFIPLEFGSVIELTDQLNRADYQSAIIYNVFIDRFYNGDRANDDPLNSPEVLPQADFHGGDLKGVIQKVKEGYFADLGVNTLWISPIVKNPKGAYGLWKDPLSKFSAYHGYWPISFTKIDERFGSEEDFHELIQVAHDNNINILLDFVANHIHQEHPFYKQNPDKVTDLYLPDGTLNTEKWDEQRLTTWFDVFLPTLDLENPEVTNMLVDSAVWWLQTYKFDGFRHDATKHIPEIFWRNLTRKVKQEVMVPQEKYIYQIGETYGSAELISSYVSTGMLEAQFDFNVYDAATGAFAREDDPFTRLNQVLQESFDYYGCHNLMGYISGNQDRARFISYAGGTLGFEEDAKWVGWNKNIGVGDPVGYKKLAMLMAFNMSIPGIPVIYYGDEYGMPGANDPDSRRMMRFDELNEKERQTLETIKKLIRLRNSSMALTYGDFYPLQVNEKTYVYMRKYFEDVQFILFNKANTKMAIEVSIPEWADVDGLRSNFGNSFDWNAGKLTMNLAPWSFEILTSED